VTASGAREWKYAIQFPKIKLFILNIYMQWLTIFIWQGKYKRSDWFFLGWDFAIRTVSVETVISCVFFVFESRQIDNNNKRSLYTSFTQDEGNQGR